LVFGDNELGAQNKNKNVRHLYTGINHFMLGYQPRTEGWEGLYACRFPQYFEQVEVVLSECMCVNLDCRITGGT
jgi:hypothetical protein